MNNEDSTMKSVEKVKASSYVWMSDFVYGGIDGSVTTFAVVAGVQGAQLSAGIVLILGVANLIADGFSMAVGKYSSDKAELERIEKIRKQELTTLREQPQAERGRIEEIMHERGFEGKCLQCAVDIISKNEEVLVETVMTYKHGVVDEKIFPVRSAMVTFLAFVAIGTVPLLAYILMPVTDLDTQRTFYIASALTLVALFIVGAVKSRFTDRSWITSGLGTMAIGGSAAALSYLVGFAISSLGVSA